MSKPDQTVWGTLHHWRPFAGTWQPLRCRLSLTPEANAGELDYSDFLPNFAGGRTYLGNYIIESAKAVARFDLNGLDGFKVDGSEIYQAQWNHNDGRWYMNLPHTAMPPVKCTVFWADPINGVKKGLLCGYVGDWLAHDWFAPYGLLLRPYGNQDDTDAFVFWRITGSAEGDGWEYGGMYRWRLEGFSNGRLTAPSRLFRVRHTDTPDWKRQTAEIEVFTFGEGSTLSRSFQIITPWVVTLSWTTGGCDGTGGSDDYWASQLEPVKTIGGVDWKKVKLASVEYNDQANAHIRGDGRILIGNAAPREAAIEDIGDPIGQVARRYSYQVKEGYSYEVYCGPEQGYRTVTVTYNTLEEVITQEVELKPYLQEPSTRWDGMHVGTTWDAWGSPEEYWILRACYTVPPGWTPVYQNRYLCVRKSDLSVYVIDWADYEENYPGAPPDTLRVYDGVPYLYAYRDTGSVLINMLTGQAVVPRADNWLYNGALPKTMEDGQYGYDGWYFYEEPSYELHETFHGDTVVAFMKDAIHVAECETEEVSGCGSGTHKAKATFAIREIISQAPVNGAVIHVSMAAYCDGGLISGPVSSSIATLADGKATFMFPSCVGCSSGAALEIRFTITGVDSPDERPYEAGANWCNEAIWMPETP